MKIGIAAVDDHPAEYIVGVDEVGYGPIAGPLVVCAAYAPRGWTLPGLTDSKLLKRAKKNETAPEIIRLAKEFDRLASTDPTHFNYCTITRTNDEIDVNGVGVCREYALADAAYITVDCCKTRTGTVPLAIVDGNMPIVGAICIVKADLHVPVVSIAAIIAKYQHDVYMRDEAAKLYPGYGFENHVGYDVPEHREGLRKLGPCAIHRRSTSTVRYFMESEIFEGDDA